MWWFLLWLLVIIFGDFTSLCKLFSKPCARDYVYIHEYVYACVGVCVCVCMHARSDLSPSLILLLLQTTS